MARVAQATSIPVATGERLMTRYEFLPLLQKQAASCRWNAAHRAANEAR